MMPLRRLRRVGLLGPLLLAACLDADTPPELDQLEDEVLTRDHRGPSLGGSVHTLDASPILELPVTLTAGRAVRFETRNRSANSDPVLHLLAPTSANGAVTEVATNDDGGGDYNARFTYTPPTSGTYLLIMRASWKDKAGTAELLRDGQPMWTALPFGGGFQRLEGLRVDEELTTVPLPGGPDAHTLYLVDDTGHIIERHASAGNRSATRRFTSARAVAIAMAGPNWPNPGGPLRLVRNDRRLTGHDPDGDLLGTELEAALGTCSRTTDVAGDFACDRATDVRDTDGDGLRDDVELLGKVSSAPYQFLPRWGADPRHKDLFLEVDFLAANTTEPTVKLTAAVARAIAAAYADPEPSALFRLANAQTLRNPDLEPGIRLHFDVGTAATDPADRTLYGDWGGHSRVAPVCSGDRCGRADADAVWRQQMHTNRHGVFHWLGGYPGGGGQSSVHSVANAIPLDNAGIAAHELGHALGLGHNGPYDGEPVDANCKPTYPSLMSYAYVHAGVRRFSDGYGRPAVNNVALTERGAVSSPTSPHGATYLQHLQDIFAYDVDFTTGDVDWNRDGSYATTPVRAYANDNGEGCEFTKYNEIELSSASRRAPALARLGDLTLALSIERDRTIVLEYTLATLSCPTATGCSAPMGRWSIPGTWNQNIDAVDAHRVTEDGLDKLLVVYRTTAGELYETEFTRTPFAFSTPRRITTSVPPIDELSLAGDATTVYLAYKGSGGRPMLKVRTAGGWGEDVLVRDTAGSLLAPLGAGVSPALLAAGPAGARTLHAVFADQGRLRLYTLDPVSLRVTRSPWTLTEEAVVGKPAMAWMPMPAGSALPGRLYLLSLTPYAAEPWRTVVRQRMLIGRRTPSGVVLSMGQEGDHQNSWLYGYGLDLLFEAGVDTNLRLLLARKLLDEDNLDTPDFLELRPNADGIIDYAQRNWNDWEVLRVDLCRTLVGAGGTGLACPAWAW